MEGDWYNKDDRTDRLIITSKEIHEYERDENGEVYHLEVVSNINSRLSADGVTASYSVQKTESTYSLTVIYKLDGVSFFSEKYYFSLNSYGELLYWLTYNNGEYMGLFTR